MLTDDPQDGYKINNLAVTVQILLFGNDCLNFIFKYSIKSFSNYNS